MPSAPPPGGGRPLVIALHGRYQTMAGIAKYSGLDGVGAKYDFTVAYPSAVGGGWNAGTCCATGAERQTADVAFIDDVIADVGSRSPTNLSRVYVVGFSNGGMMAYRYGCERSSTVAGIGVVAGAMVADASFAQPSAPQCKPTAPTALFHAHGEKDTVVRISGGYHEGLHSNTTSQTTSTSLYRSAAGCTSSTLSRQSQYSVRTHTGCRTSGPRGVMSVRIKDLGHTWTRSGFGYDTTEAMWNFLKVQHKSQPSGQ